MAPRASFKLVIFVTVGALALVLTVWKGTERLPVVEPTDTANELRPAFGGPVTRCGCAEAPQLAVQSQDPPTPPPSPSPSPSPSESSSVSPSPSVFLPELGPGPWQPSPDNETVLIIARNRLKESMHWLNEQPYRYVVMEKGLPEGTPNNLPLNRGLDSASYLQFILEHWTHLPARMIFLHGHRESEHSGVRAVVNVPQTSE